MEQISDRQKAVNAEDGEQEQMVVNFIETNLFFLRVTGWWDDPRWSPALRALYAISTGLALFFHCVLVVTVTVNMAVEWRDITVALDTAAIFLVGMTNGAKIYPFVFSRDKVRLCLRRLEEMEATGPPTAGRRAAVAVARRQVARVGWTLIASCMTSGAAWLVVPFALKGSAPQSTAWEETASNDSTVMPLLDHGSTGHKALPLQGWLPFDVNSSPGWEAGYFLLGTATLVDCWIACQTNNIFFALLYFACTHFRVLSDSLREMHAQASQRAEQRARTGNVAKQAAFENEMASSLRQAVLLHQAILSLIDAVQDLMGPVMFAECLAMSIMLCCNVFQASLISPFSIKFMALVLFLFFEMLELLLFCWVGTKLEERSEEVGDAAFACGWQDCAPPFKSSLRFVQMRAQKPSQVTALGFSTLSLPLFAALLRASYSYYALLSQVNEPE